MGAFEAENLRKSILKSVVAVICEQKGRNRNCNQMQGFRVGPQKTPKPGQFRPNPEHPCRKDNGYVAGTKHLEIFHLDSYPFAPVSHCLPLSLYNSSPPRPPESRSTFFPVQRLSFSANLPASLYLNLLHYGIT